MGSPVGSFLKFVIGFTVFISVSFGVTYAVNTYTDAHEQDQMAASALKAMLAH